MSSSKQVDDLLMAIRSLPVPERLKLVERVVHEVAGTEAAGTSRTEARSIIGLFADEPELMDAVCESAMMARERDPLRRL